MSILASIKRLIGSAPAKVAIATGASILTQAVVAAAHSSNPIGAKALEVATALEATGKTGAEKKAAVIAAIVPLIGLEAPGALIRDLEAFAALVVEEVVSQMKQTLLVALALRIAHAFGL